MHNSSSCHHFRSVKSKDCPQYPVCKDNSSMHFYAGDSLIPMWNSLPSYDLRVAPFDFYVCKCKGKIKKPGLGYSNLLSISIYYNVPWISVYYFCTQIRKLCHIFSKKCYWPHESNLSRHSWSRIKCSYLPRIARNLPYEIVKYLPNTASSQHTKGV